MNLRTYNDHFVDPLRVLQLITYRMNILTHSAVIVEEETDDHHMPSRHRKGHTFAQTALRAEVVVKRRSLEAGLCRLMI